MASSAANAKVWHTLEIDAENVIDGTTIDIRDRYTDKRLHGIYLDYLEVRKIDTWKRKPNTLRVILWNIQNGMWADQGNNYDNFVEWMRRADTDVVIFCEAQSNYVTDIDKRLPEPIAERYLPSHWGEFAARWGHSYWVIGAHQDNHPVVVTSKYPLTLVQALGGEQCCECEGVAYA